MSIADVILDVIEANRERTLETLKAIAALPDPQAALSWRPGPGRAHAGWQFMHVAITEELFATERLSDQPAGFAHLRESFQRGSVPTDQAPSLDEILQVLASAREHLRATLRGISDADLDTIPPGLAERGWTNRKALQILAWHEPHHQGQAHLTLNMYRAQNPG